MYQNLLQEKIISAPEFFHMLMAINDNAHKASQEETRRFSMRLGDKEISFDSFTNGNVIITPTN